MILVVISHTAHYSTAEGKVLGWGPTITEINHLAQVFDKIYHLAFFHRGEDPPASSLPYTSSRIELVPLPPSGGKTIREKFSVVAAIPATLKKVYKILRIVDVFQFRAPTGMGFYMIPYLTLFERKKGWYKYAGNWKEERPPAGYELQRWMLKKQYRKVSVNGFWPGQSENIISFENPCLTGEDREIGEKVIQNKSKGNSISICFVGNLTTNKGFNLLMESLKKLKNEWSVIHVLGDGPLREMYESQIEGVQFYGYQPKEKIHEIYIECQFIILPSLSEGFPKVIAEAMNYGCIPIVSDISAIGQYVKNEENGFLIKPVTEDSLILSLRRAFRINEEKFKKMIKLNYILSSKFTYEAYLEGIKNRILEDH